MINRRILNYKQQQTNYFRITFEGGGLSDSGKTITVHMGAKKNNFYYLEFSRDEGKTWQRITNTDSQFDYTIPDVEVGYSVLFRGNGIRTSNNSTQTDVILKFFGNSKFRVSGLLMSLLKGREATSETLLTETYQFSGLFFGSTNLVSAKDLVFPPNTTVNCYRLMFYGCSNLLYGPTLPANTLSSNCYLSMFQNCGKLSYIKMLATNISASACLTDWMRGVSGNNLEFHRSPEATWMVTGVSGIPSYSCLFDGTEEESEEVVFKDPEIHRLCLGRYGNRKPPYFNPVYQNYCYDWSYQIRIGGVDGKILKKQVDKVTAFSNLFTQNKIIVDFSDCSEKFPNLVAFGTRGATGGIPAIGKTFFNCTSLKYLTIPPKVTTLSGGYVYSDGVFKGTALEELYIPDSVVAASDAAFQNCVSLKRVRWSSNLPIKTNTTQWGGNSTFWGCYNLETIENFPRDKATDLRSNFFRDCSKLNLIDCVDFSLVTTLGEYGLFGPILPQSIIFSSLKWFGRHPFYAAANRGLCKVYCPNLSQAVNDWFTDSPIRLLDFKTTATGGNFRITRWGDVTTPKINGASTVFVLRYKTAPGFSKVTYSTTAAQNEARIYIYPEEVDEFKATYTNCRNVFDIGGTQWVSDFGNENEWADYPLYSYCQNSSPLKISTEVCADDNTKIEVKFATNNTSSFYAIGTRESTDGKHIFSITGSYQDQSIIFAVNGVSQKTTLTRGSEWQTYEATLQTNGDMTFSYQITDGVNSDSQSSISYEDSLEGNELPIYLFSNGFNDISSDSLRIYYIKIYKGGDLIKELRPCEVNEENKLLDFVSFGCLPSEEGLTYL